MKKSRLFDAVNAVLLAFVNVYCKGVHRCYADKEPTRRYKKTALIKCMGHVTPLSVAALIAFLSNTGLVYAKEPALDIHALPGIAIQLPKSRSAALTKNLDPGIDLSVDIFSLMGELAVGPAVGPSYSTSGKGKLKITDHKGRYHAKWKTKESGQPDESLLRVEVRSSNALPDNSACNNGVDVDSGCLAYFDVMLHKNKKNSNWADTPEGVMPLVNGQELSIKIHIASGSLDQTAVLQLDGNDNDPATSAIPELTYTLRAEDFSDDHPELGGHMVSFNTLSLAFTLDTTVGEANTILAALGARIVGGMPGVADQIEGVLLLQLPITTHAEMIATIEALRANPNVKIAVQESLLEPKTISRPNGGTPIWEWEVTPSAFTVNWGLAMVRVPQMWGLNDAIKKQGTSTVVGVHDVGFSTSHPDLVYQTITSTNQHNHGTHVAGTIGAVFDNGVGVDGVNPFARLVVNDNDHISATGWGLINFISARNDLRVVNVSLGNNWYNDVPLRNPNTWMPIQILVTEQAKLFKLMQNILKFSGQKLPMIFAAAGNDSGPPLGANVDARWSSSMNYAALVLGVDNILVVEAVALNAGDVGGATRANFSNVTDVKGHVSAPGVDIMSTAFFPLQYFLDSGTSMATPHVTGLASYLLSLDPALTNPELRQLLLGNTVPVGGGAKPRIDSFASSLAIDGIRGNNDILMKLVDIDDGSLDGNQRTSCDVTNTSCPDFFDPDVDGDGGRGDGQIDMADFRAWRDRFLQIENDPGLLLDGSANHPKKDLNGDNLVQSPPQENIFPQGDFNGDGVIDLTGTSHVPGAINTEVTDLEVMEYLFNDPNYQIGDLQGLIRSWDIKVNTHKCFSQLGAAEIRSMLFVAGSTTLLEERVHTNDEAIHIYTVPSENGYTLKIQAFDDSGMVLGGTQKDFSPKLGADDAFHPECSYILAQPEILELTLNLDQTLDRTIDLVSYRLTADYDVSSTVPNVVVNNDRGTVEADSTHTLSLTMACPSSGVGVYNYSFDFNWVDEGGSSISVNVPETIEIALTCEDETELCPDPTVSTELSTTDLSNGANINHAIDINACGQILAGTTPSYGSSNLDNPYLFLPAAAYGLPAGWNLLADHGILMKPAAMNDQGQIVGDDLEGQAALWSWDDGLTSLVPLAEMNRGGNAHDINNLGQVVGKAGNCVFDSNSGITECTNTAYIWLPEAAYGLSAGFHGLGIPDVFDRLTIDNNGAIFGTVSVHSDEEPYEFFVWQEGSLTMLGSLGGANKARRNSLGQIVARYPQPGIPSSQCPCDSFLLDTDGTVTSLGSFGEGTSTDINAINDQGVIIGYSLGPLDNHFSHAYVWKDGVMHDFGTLGGTISRVYAFNEHGQFVGASATHPVNALPYRAVLWELGIP